MKLEREIVDAILKDLTGRRGLRQSWDAIDDEIQEEIRQKWAELVREKLEGRQR